MEPMWLLLATSRRATCDFFTSLTRSTAAAYTVICLPVAVEALAQHARDLATARLVAIDVYHDPDAAVQFCRAVREWRPELPLLALVCCTHLHRVRTFQRLLAAGVHSYIDSSVEPEQLPHLLRRAAQGSRVVHLDLSPEQETLLEGLIGGHRRAPRARGIFLPSGSDIEVLALVARGLSDRQIGQQLHRSEHTIDHHVKRLCETAGVSNRTALAAWAVRHGFDRLPAEEREERHSAPGR